MNAIKRSKPEAEQESPELLEENTPASTNKEKKEKREKENKE